MAGDRIEVTIELVDEISDRLEKIESNTGSMTGSMLKANVAMAAATAAMGALKGAAKALANVTKEAVSAAANFEYDMVRIGNVGNITGEELAALGDTIRDMGIKSIFTTQQMQEAFYQLAAAGNYTDDELKMLMSSFSEMATATGSDLVQSTVSASKAMNAFGLSADQAASVADTLTQAANMSALEVTDLTIALGYVGGQAKGAGMDLQETSAILSQLSNLGYNASTSATNLRMAILEMGDPSKESQKIMRKLGVEFFDSAGNMRDMTDIIPELESAMSSLTTETKLQYTKTLFGVRAGSMMLSMMNAETAAAQGTGLSLNTLTEAMYEQGVAAQQAANITQTTKAQFDILTGTVKDLVMDLGMGVIGSEGMQEAIAGLTSILSDPALKESLTLIGNVIGDILVMVMPILGEVIQALLPVIGQLAGFLSDLLPIIQPLIDFVGQFLVKAFEKLGPIMEKIFPVLLELASAVVTALLPALDEFLPLLDMIGPLFEAAIPVIEAVIPIIHALAPVIKLIATLLATSLNTGIRQLIGIMGIAAPLLEFIADIFEFLAEPIEIVSDFIGGMATAFSALSTPLEIVADLLDAVTGGLDAVVGVIQDAGSEILDFITFWDPPGPCLAEAIDTSIESIQNLKGELSDLPSAIGNVTPSVIGLTTNFADQEIGTQTIAKSFMGGVAGEEKNVTVIIEGDVLNDTMVDKIAGAASGESDELSALSGYYGPV